MLYIYTPGMVREGAGGPHPRRGQNNGADVIWYRREKGNFSGRCSGDLLPRRRVAVVVVVVGRRLVRRRVDGVVRVVVLVGVVVGVVVVVEVVLLGVVGALGAGYQHSRPVGVSPNFPGLVLPVRERLRRWLRGRPVVAAKSQDLRVSGALGSTSTRWEAREVGICGALCLSAAMTLRRVVATTICVARAV